MKVMSINSVKKFLENVQKLFKEQDDKIENFLKKETYTEGNIIVTKQSNIVTIQGYVVPASNAGGSVELIELKDEYRPSSVKDFIYIQEDSSDAKGKGKNGKIYTNGKVTAYSSTITTEKIFISTTYII